MRHFAAVVFADRGLRVFCTAQMAKSAPPVDVAIHAGKVLDVRTGNYLSDQIIWIEGDRIKADR